MNNLNNKEKRYIVNPTCKALSDGMYNMVIGAVLLYGFIVNAIMINSFEHIALSMNPWVLIIGYIVCVILGAVLTANESPFISFIGFNFIVLPMGLMLSGIVNSYAPDLVFKAIVITGMITLVMMVAGGMFPSIFLKMGRALFFTLLAVIIVDLLCVLVFKMDLAILDYIVVLIFSGYIGYDWAKANQYPKTLNNAVDSAADLYMDIINVFIRILSILGRNE